ncbi:MAG: RNase adapter RapZ [Acidimicrobiia bacterium]|nr:RNase adapter RapZ [Acidimicrobiia bacterium]
MITGLSGGGRTQAGDHLEDLGWFVIDNLPPSLIPKVAELARAPGSTTDRVALVVGTGPYHQEVMPAVEELRRHAGRVRILYLEAATDVLVRRYESTRRRHPLAEGRSLAEAIEAERELLEPVRAEADVIVDTTELNVHDLRDRVVDLFGDEADDKGMQTVVMSFGYKHGLPLDVDVVLDCRFLPNPHWEDELRELTGLDEKVRAYVLDRTISDDFLERLLALLRLLIPAYVEEGKSILSIGFGCTGGRHRSVAIAEEVAGVLRQQGHDPTVTHRDLER